MLSIAEIGLVSKVKIIPSEKIWTPEPEKYSITACMGNAFAGLCLSVMKREHLGLLEAEKDRGRAGSR